MVSSMKNLLESWREPVQVFFIEREPGFISAVPIHGKRIEV